MPKQDKALKRQKRKTERAKRRQALQQDIDRRQHARLRVAEQQLVSAVDGLVQKIMTAGSVDEANARLILAEQLAKQQVLDQSPTVASKNVQLPADVLPDQGFSRAAWGQQ